MKKVLLLLLLTASIISAQTAGKTGLSFLKFGFGAKNIALADLGVVTADDVSAVNYNPALLTNYQSSQILLTHNEWLTDVRSELLGISFRMFGLPFAVGVNYSTVADIPVRTGPGEAQSTFNANNFYGSLSTGFGIAKNLNFGLTAKYITENQLTDEASGYAFDFGFLYDGLYKNLRIGLSLKNLGSMNELRSEASKLPVDLRVGASYSYGLGSLNSELLVAAGYQKYLESDDNHISFGGEFLYKKILAIRVGYMSGYETKGLTTGLGLVWSKLNFDYAFVPYDYDLGNSHIISVKYTF